MVFRLPGILIGVAEISAARWIETLGDATHLHVGGLAAFPANPADHQLAHVGDEFGPFGDFIAVLPGKVLALAELQEVTHDPVLIGGVGVCLEEVPIRNGQRSTLVLGHRVHDFVSRVRMRHAPRGYPA
ncbi:UNVERIFIED_ORG: hypothetical protein M2438_002684 [Methylobacterium sp. SuP10 SLI 274]|uniref:hypothetical protein n=1 Tax=Methylorubrum extorquens TaxID=408 RepID=UPI00209F5F38|nr:hypothetical protein [Methylorubrum extorquens]MDF9863916.1 hypothetical protein [Methylorubrum pseudosasae]MDH6637509.1 hypothetical protein [Methylobacterium sp. SuP10 SLI 274]MDH6666689.1 hypothetical protein [Methylorubrum zatmanii]MCP1558597.1 hypothetical protein [Methylorubrum extorquens]MDF9792226.1 hypothetical protein [Methylorubrum extorquens]